MPTGSGRSWQGLGQEARSRDGEPGVKEVSGSAGRCGLWRCERRDAEVPLTVRSRSAVDRCAPVPVCRACPFQARMLPEHACAQGRARRHKADVRRFPASHQSKVRGCVPGQELSTYRARSNASHGREGAPGLSCATSDYSAFAPTCQGRRSGCHANARVAVLPGQVWLRTYSLCVLIFQDGARQVSSWRKRASRDGVMACSTARYAMAMNHGYSEERL